jgi:hypothetical protein
MKNFRELHNLHLTKHYSGDQIKEDEKYRSCSTHGRDDKCLQYFGQKNRRKEPRREESIVTDLTEKGQGVVD